MVTWSFLPFAVNAILNLSNVSQQLSSLPIIKGCILFRKKASRQSCMRLGMSKAESLARRKLFTGVSTYTTQRVNCDESQYVTWVVYLLDVLTTTHAVFWIQRMLLWKRVAGLRASLVITTRLDL